MIRICDWLTDWLIVIRVSHGNRASLEEQEFWLGWMGINTYFIQWHAESIHDFYVMMYKPKIKFTFTLNVVVANMKEKQGFKNSWL